MSKRKKILPQHKPNWEPSPDYIRAECEKIKAEKRARGEMPLLDSNVRERVLDELLAGIEDEDFEEMDE